VKKRKKENRSSIDLIKNHELLPTEEQTKIPRKSTDLSIIKPETSRVRMVEIIINLVLKEGINMITIRKTGIL
jgi:hypothetical protein